ncbi:MAG: TetR/AcrR family transcriptional regulator [Alphaproteobacteria bacterium HGW-Alphaproteobacteria-16]|nr:MAG: TetR/AcrR family transcriptional regulator [Alphaproteobacteria bacterium HGW-Alphaproteobacteria-16]
MSRPAPALLQPRKSPRQTRSIVTVEAIYAATIQVLLSEGVGKLTTTRVAERAGVSVGTMYQYYPHKQALLFAVVERQLEMIMAAMGDVAERLEGCDLARLGEGLAVGWIDAKTADVVASRAIYGIAGEFDLSEVMHRATVRMVELIRDLLVRAPDARFEDPDAVAFMVAAMLGGSVRVVMENGVLPQHVERLRRELPRACQAYLAVASASG